MGYYVIFASDVVGSLLLRQQTRPAHLKRLDELDIQNRLLAAGPMPIEDDESAVAGFSGSCIIAQFDTLEDAKKWAQADPYMAAGVYANIVVKPFKKVFPK